LLEGKEKEGEGVMVEVTKEVLDEQARRVDEGLPLTVPLAVLDGPIKARFGVWVDKQAKMREYMRRPEVKAKMREYSQRPEVKAKKREYSQRPEVKAKMREYSQRPEVKAKKRKYDRAYYRRMKRKGAVL
jgi:hypothetical protein